MFLCLFFWGVVIFGCFFLIVRNLCWGETKRLAAVTGLISLLGAVV